MLANEDLEAVVTTAIEAGIQKYDPYTRMNGCPFFVVESNVSLLGGAFVSTDAAWLADESGACTPGAQGRSASVDMCPA
jgi:hypothetical protein